MNADPIVPLSGLPADLGEDDCLYFTRFRPDPTGDGGFRRCAQIAALLAPWQPRVVSVLRDEPRWTAVDGFMARLLRGRFDDIWLPRIQQRATDGEFLQWQPGRQRFVWLLRTAAREYAHALRQGGRGPRLAIIDDPLFVHPLVGQLRAQGVPVVAACTDLQSLARWQVTPEGQMPLLTKELQWLAACDLVITISHEETYLLRNVGAKALFLPYYPQEPMTSRLLAIRRARRDAAPSSVLLLGSGGNQATIDGMAAIMRAWHELDLADQGVALRVAGFGTEALQRAVPAGARGVTLLGSLSAGDLDRELAGTLACLCHQEDGAGALTRIMDLLVAGVPVLASQHAARSYHHIPGVYEYTTIRELVAQLPLVRAAAPVVPLPPEPDVTEARARIAALASPQGARS